MTTFTFDLSFEAKIEADNLETAQDKLTRFIWEDRPRDIILLGVARYITNSDNIK